MKKNILLTLCVAFLIFLILALLINIPSLFSVQLETKTVWITSGLESSSPGAEPGSYSTWVSYDDHNGETGRLYANKYYSIGDTVTVIRDANNHSETDSTHGWTISDDFSSEEEMEKSLKKDNLINVIVNIIFILIFSIFLKMLLKKPNDSVKEENSENNL